MLKKLVVLGAMLIMIFTFMACEPPLDDDGNKELRAGFEISSGDPAPPIWCAFISEKSKLQEGEDLTVSLYYGTSYVFSSENEEYTPIAIFAEITMGNSEYLYVGKTYGQDEYNIIPLTQIIVKEIDDFSNQNFPPYLETTPERIVIPSVYFSSKCGSIGWAVTMYVVLSEDSEPEHYASGGIALYYRKEGENIILFDSYYKFYNDIRK